jgi:hypothetical protein
LGENLKVFLSINMEKKAASESVIWYTHLMAQAAGLFG